MTTEELMAMSDVQLRKFADEVLGIPFPKKATRDTMLTWIVNSAAV